MEKKKKQIEFGLAGYIRFPADWIILREIEKAKYVGIVSCRSKNHKNTPRFIFASPKPINELTEKEQDEILAECSLRSDAFADANKNEPTSIGIFDVTMFEDISDAVGMEIVWIGEDALKECKDKITKFKHHK